MLQRICKSIERRRAGGQSFRRAVRYAAWYWRERTYRAAPKVKVKLSRHTIRTLYYRWRRSGKRLGCFALQYKTRCCPVSRSLVGQFLRSCAAPGICSLAAAWARLQPAGVSIRALTEATPEALRLAIRAALRERRKLRGQEARLARRIEALASQVGKAPHFVYRASEVRKV
jgi:hypothetical protein